MDVLCFIALFTCLHAKRVGHVGLTASGAPSDEQVSMLGDILASCQPFDQTAVEFPTGSVVNIGDIGFRLIEPSAFDQAFQVIGLYSMSTRRPKRSSKETSFIFGSFI